jgi:L-fucose:H+ symporter permease
MGMIADGDNPVLPFVLPLAGFLVVLAYAWKMASKG